MNVFLITKILKLKDYSSPVKQEFGADVEANELIQVDENLTDQIFFKFNGKNTFGDLIVSEYDCQLDDKIRKSGFVYGLKFKFYFERHSFKAYATGNLLLLNESTSNALKFTKRIRRESEGSFEVDVIDVNFKKVISNTENVQGVSFRMYNSTNITSKQFHGYRITDDPEFNEVMKQGKISSLTIEYIYKGRAYSAIISKKGSIYIQTAGTNKSEALNVTLDIYKKLLI